MNKSKLCTHIAAQDSVSKATAGTVVSALFSTIGEAPARNETVAIASFGSFTTRTHATRHGRNPRTSENIAVAASKTSASEAGKKLRGTVNDPTLAFEV